LPLGSGKTRASGNSARAARSAHRIEELECGGAYTIVVKKGQCTQVSSPRRGPRGKWEHARKVVVYLNALTRITRRHRYLVAWQEIVIPADIWRRRRACTGRYTSLAAGPTYCFNRGEQRFSFNHGERRVGYHLRRQLIRTCAHAQIFAPRWRARSFWELSGNQSKSIGTLHRPVGTKTDAVISNEVFIRANIWRFRNTRASRHHTFTASSTDLIDKLENETCIFAVNKLF